MSDNIQVGDFVTSFESVQNQTTEEYFRGNQFAIDAFNKKYTAFAGETYVQAIKRVCDYIASAEATEEDRQYWSKRWFDEIYNDWWHPAGSIMQGAASGRNVSMANCTTISLGYLSNGEEWDNLESIIKNTTYTVAKCAAYRQGLGVEYSRLRPAKMTVRNSANESSGAVHWMKLIDSIGYYVGQKGRIPAMLFSLRCDHPDVIEFITAKADYTKIQNANISVQCTNAFYKAVENDDDWNLHFDIPEVKCGDKVYVDVHSADSSTLIEEGTDRRYYIALKDRPGEHYETQVKARALLELIAKNMKSHAEPGIQNIDVARLYSNSDYVYDPNAAYDSRILSTNACSEQYLSRESLCVLGSINMGRFSPNPKMYEIELAKIGPSINRFLDNVNEMELRGNTYATPHQKLAIEMLRRTGAGVTNFAGWLFKRNEEYGTAQGNASSTDFMERYNYYLYKSSIELGREKGSFGLFDREKFEQSPFVQRMMGLGLKFDAMRNVTCSSIAPTGTLTLMFRDLLFSYGIEPAFGPYFWKRTRISGKYEYYFCVPAIVRQTLAEHGIHLPLEGDAVRDSWDGKIGRPIAEQIEKAFADLKINFRNATSVSPFDKLDLMAGVMKWCDSSISVTYLLPEDSDWKDVYNFIIEANKREVKSIAAFPDKKMYGIVSFVPFKDLAVNLTREGVGIHDQNFSPEELDELQRLTATVAESTDRIVKTNAPLRPKSLNCDVHHIRFTKRLDKPRTFDYLVIVGLLRNDPYEVFVMENGFLPKSYTSGVLTRKRRGVYEVSFEDGTKIEDVTKDTTEVEDIFTRMTSTSLRHGADISYVVEQLEKAEGDMWSFGKAMARALKKYIKDGTVTTKGGCPVCGSDLIRSEGCKTCIKPECGWSACS